MKRKFLLAVVLLSLVLMVAFAVHVINHRQGVRHLKIAAGSQQGESYRFSQLVAQMVTQDEPRIKIEVIETKGSEENIKLLEENKVQLATAQADIPVLPSARLVSYLFPDMYQLLVTEQSGIQTFSDLRGKRIALPPKGSGQYKSFWFLAEHYGLQPKDLTEFDLSEQAADAAFSSNKVDAVFRVRSPGNQSILSLVQKSRGRLVPVEQAAAIKIKKPEVEVAVIPKGAYQGAPPIPATDLPTVAVQRTLLANEKVDAEIIQKITSTLYERRQNLLTTMPLASYITPPDALKGTGIPIHPGAKAYYDREKPSFLKENSDLVGLLMSIALLLGSWLWELNSLVQRRQKNRADKNNKEIITLIEEIYNTTDLKRIRAIRKELFDMFKFVVDDLDQDRISTDSFQSFTFAWETAIAAVRERESLLLQSHIADINNSQQSTEEQSTEVGKC